VSQAVASREKRASCYKKENRKIRVRQKNRLHIYEYNHSCWKLGNVPSILALEMLWGVHAPKYERSVYFELNHFSLCFFMRLHQMT
jgi:hypothetical protein